MPLFGARSPVSQRAQHWVESSTSWLAAEFGRAPLERPIVRLRPLVDDLAMLPPELRIGRVIPLVGSRMGISPENLSVHVLDDDSIVELPGVPAVARYAGAAGQFARHDGSNEVLIGRSQLTRVGPLVATVAHEFAHMKLLGEGLLTADQSDQEQLTDLAVVYFGFGIFAANAAFDFAQTATGWRRSEQGYLGEALFGYALAHYAWLRGESSPSWADDLDTNPRGYFRQALRHVRKHGQRATQSPRPI